MILDHTDRNKRYFPSNANPVRRNLVQDMVSFWCQAMLSTLLSSVSRVPMPNVQSDVWDHVQSYTICMLLVCRLKLIPTSDLKLIISFLVLHIVLLSLIQVIITCSLNLACSLNLVCLLEVGQQA
jgi:hypothetical protein